MLDSPLFQKKKQKKEQYCMPTSKFSNRSISPISCIRIYVKLVTYKDLIKTWNIWHSNYVCSLPFPV